MFHPLKHGVGFPASTWQKLSWRAATTATTTGRRRSSRIELMALSLFATKSSVPTQRRSSGGWSWRRKKWWRRRGSMMIKMQKKRYQCFFFFRLDLCLLAKILGNYNSFEIELLITSPSRHWSAFSIRILAWVVGYYTIIHVPQILVLSSVFYWTWTVV